MTTYHVLNGVNGSCSVLICIICFNRLAKPITIGVLRFTDCRVLEYKSNNTGNNFKQNNQEQNNCILQGKIYIYTTWENK